MEGGCRRTKSQRVKAGIRGGSENGSGDLLTRPGSNISDGPTGPLGGLRRKAQGPGLDTSLLPSDGTVLFDTSLFNNTEKRITRRKTVD